MIKYDLTYIIDDDLIFVFVLKKILSKIEGFNTIENIKNGHDAIINLKLLYDNKEEFPDIIFLDINMPVLDGWQFLEEVERLPFKDKLNIYIVSSTIDTREIEKYKEYATVKKFISKPVNTSILIQLLGIQ